MKIKSVLCRAAHVLHGFVSGFLSLSNLPISVFLYAQFLTYEFVEWRIKRDKMYPELREWIAGFTVGLVIKYFLSLQYL